MYQRSTKLKVLVFGADGFVGRAVVQELSSYHEVVSSTAKKTDPHYADLSDRKSVYQLLSRVKPKVLINCAGVVENTEKARLNVDFTMNILHAITETNTAVDKVIIMGSAAEFGMLNMHGLPVSEDIPRMPEGSYGLSKKEEVDQALTYGKKHELNVVVARLFNPLGPGMKGKFLVGSILKQLSELQSESRDAIEVNRLDAKRDYIDVRDVATAIRSLADGPLSYSVYNIGSGHATTNKTVIDGLIGLCGMENRVVIREMEPKAEPEVAERANISRITTDTAWSPRYTILDTLRSVSDA